MKKITKWQDLIGNSFLDRNEKDEGPYTILQVFCTLVHFGKDKGKFEWMVITFAPQYGISWSRFNPMTEKQFIKVYMDGTSFVCKSEFEIVQYKKGFTSPEPSGWLECSKHGKTMRRFGNAVLSDFPCPTCRSDVRRYRKWLKELPTPKNPVKKK